MIRDATDADCEAISRLNNSVQALHARALPRLFKPASPNSFSPEEIAACIAREGSILGIALEGGQPAGYIYAAIERRDADARRYATERVYIHHIAVSPAHRRQGVGRDLVDYVKAKSAEKGIRTIALDFWSFNDAARAFFQSCGFSTFNERMWCETEI